MQSGAAGARMRRRKGRRRVEASLRLCRCGLVWELADGASRDGRRPGGQGAARVRETFMTKGQRTKTKQCVCVCEW
jgi:hypothetical protein